MLVVGLLIGAGCIIAAISAFPDIDSFPRATSTNTSVELAEGEWTVFIEDGFRADLRIIGPDGAEVPIRSSSSSANYNLGGRSGESIGELVVTTAGVHDVVGDGNGTIAFASPGTISGIFRAIALGLAGILIGGGLVLAGAVMTLISLLRK